MKTYQCALLPTNERTEWEEVEASCREEAGERFVRDFLSDELTEGDEVCVSIQDGARRFKSTYVVELGFFHAGEEELS